jgi:hypothetical protein
VGTGPASEMTFDLAEDIVRTVSLASSPTAGRALAFGDSSIYAISQDTQGWSLDVLEDVSCQKTNGMPSVPTYSENFEICPQPRHAGIPG